ncbi:zinc finger protein 37-like isoform X3 [Planococcus citri]|uniref:zinc finger protein 37-like isoform X3 n=1 Tax=Planococcus citri TaxID=170843 RepID=UPI0031F9BD9C
MDLSDSFSEEKTEQGVLGTSGDQDVTSNQFKNNITCKIENDAYQSDQENDEPYEIQDETDEQFTGNEDMCVACGYVSAYEFFSFPINVDIRKQWAKFCDINLDKIKPHFRLCDGHFKPEDYQISMQRRVLMPTSVPTLRLKVKHNFTPSISQSLQSGPDVNSFSKPMLNKNTSQNAISSSDFEKNSADSPNKRLGRNFRDITNNHGTVPPKAAKLTSKKNFGKYQLLTKHFRSDIFRLKIRCSRLEDTVANFKNEIKQQVEECFVTRANTAGNVARDIQNSASSINASSGNSRHNLCNTEARTDRRSVKDALVGSTEHVTEDGYSTDTSMASLAISIDDPQKVEVKPELFTEEVMLEFDEPAERIAEENHSVNPTISLRRICTGRLQNAVAKLEQFSNEVATAETSRTVTENNRCPLTTSSAENSNSRRCGTEDPPAQHFEEVIPAEPENSNEDSQSPNSTIPSSEKSHESRNKAEPRAGCSKNQEKSGQGRITRSAKQKKHLPSVKKPTRNSSNVSNKIEVRMRNLFPHRCDICGAMFSYKGDWTRHQQREHTKPIHRQTSDKQFASKSDFIERGLTHSEKKLYKCSKWAHERVHREGARFKCVDCGKKFSHKENLIRHLRIHSGVKPFSCQTCNKRFTRKDHLTNHQRSHSNEKRYKCGICDARFKNYASKWRHERVHAEGACLECAVCGKKLSYKHDLIRHLRLHSGVKPFSCQTCSKSFAEKASLTKHQRTHSKENPFKCRICNKQFSQHGCRARHERTHVEGTQFECAHCGNKFSRKRTLANHISSKCT